MPNINIKLINNKGLKSARLLKRNFKNGIRKAMIDISFEVKSEAKRLILDPPKTGRIYPVYLKRLKKKIYHQSSAPYEAPANLTGQLMKSIRSKVGSQGNRFTLSAGNNRVSYAADLEFGNIRRNLLPRPYLISSINNKSSYITQKFYSSIRFEINIC